MSVLEKIIQAKRRRIGIQKLSNSFTDHYINVNESTKASRFFDELSKCSNKYKIIAEMKKASPSAGLLVEKYIPEQLAKEYESKGFSNLSILTEEDHFLGSMNHISKVKKVTNLPVLQKDFIVDEW